MACSLTETEKDWIASFMRWSSPLNPALSSDPVLRDLEALETRRPKFAPVLHPTLQTGVESLVVAARAWLPG